MAAVGAEGCDHKGAPVTELILYWCRESGVYVVLAAATSVEAVVAVGGRRLSIELGMRFDRGGWGVHGGCLAGKGVLVRVWLRSTIQ